MSKTRAQRRAARPQPAVVPMRDEPPAVDDTAAAPLEGMSRNGVLEETWLPAAEARLRTLTLGVESARAALDEGVRSARAGGTSWHRIGMATRLTAEGARRRWGRS